MTDQQLKEEFIEWASDLSCIDDGQELNVTPKQLSVLADWFLSRRHTDQEELVRAVEGMKKHPTEDQEDSAEYDEGFDSALDAVPSLLAKRNEM